MYSLKGAKMANNVWDGDWRSRVMARIRSAGCDSVTEFLSKSPAAPYVKAAAMLGEDVAALQLESLQFEEAMDQSAIRWAAMDSLVRELAYHLPQGWRSGAKGDFSTAGAYADWIVRIEQKQPDLRSKAKAVWDTLESLQPPVEWLPASTQDPFIVKAFSEKWPQE